MKARSEIPIGSGLKSSSAAANAAVVATLDAIGEEAKVKTEALEAIRIGVDAALDVDVSITGVFDDACASMLGGIVLTDNRKRELIKRLEKDSAVLIFVPWERAYTADTDVKLYCVALNFDPEPMVKALECGVKGVSLAGIGPSFVALLDEGKEQEERVREAWGELGVEGGIMKRRIHNKLSFFV